MYFVERFWGSTTYIVWLWVIAFGFALLNTSASQGLTYGVVQVDAEGVVIKNRLRPPLPWAELSAVHIGLAPNDAVLYVKFMLANGMKVNLFHRDGLNNIANAIGEFAPEGVTIHRQGAGWLWRLLMPWRK